MSEAPPTVPGSSPRGRGKRVEGGGRQRCQRLIPAWAGKTRGYGRADRGLTAHPRVGGENVTQLAPGELSNGSSPRGRGKLLVGVGGRLRPRLIPAWAGKTMTAIEARACSGAHPRVGGENVGGPLAVFGVPGSSPRGRGKRSDSKKTQPSSRLIPAWAGKTPLNSTSVRRRWAHPRVGGENFDEHPRQLSRHGSSPRGRGKRGQDGAGALPARLIPAWAGKTRNAHTHRKDDRAHPRVGGENACARALTFETPGSSPRGRGKRHAEVGDVAHGLAHPRVGGENAAVLVLICCWSGSSPRGRGKPKPSHGCLAASGLIPAWAGKTTGPTTARPACPAHPRVGGENVATTYTVGSQRGSSPRGRGKRDHDLAHTDRAGLIPAWAGKTSALSYSLPQAWAHPRVGGENRPQHR